MAALIILMTSTNTTWARTNFVNTPSRKPSIIFHRLPINNSSKEESSFLKPLPFYPAFDFKSYIHQKVTSVNIALDKAVPLKEPIEIFEPMRYSLIFNGGKRVKPILLIAACELFGGQEQTAMPAACAMEMIHAMSLIHDDLPIMDNDDFRRGNPSCHRVFGAASALLAGDALLSHAFDHLVEAYSKSGFVSSGKLVRIIGELARGSGPEGLMGGQLIDMKSSEKTSGLGLDYVESMHMRKAGALIEKSAVIGAILGGASDEDVERLRSFASCMGHFFGVMDDILDVEQDGLHDKATYPKAFGTMEKAKDFAMKLRREALEMLTGYGYDEEKAAPFSALIDYIANVYGLWGR